MSNVISIRNNFPKAAAALDRMGKDVGDKAMVRALNETVRQGKTAMARQIVKEFRVTTAQAKDRMDVTYAKAKGGGIRFSASLKATKRLKGRGMNLIHFVTQIPVRTKRGKLAQLKFQIKRTGGRKSIKGAFVGINRKTGGRAVFIREGKARLPIRTLTTIDIPQMFNTMRINTVIRTVMQQRFDINFQRQLRAVLKGFAR
ncbi:MAG: phage tail protein [Sterolibacterium sp.]|jgi:hypothetical protein